VLRTTDKACRADLAQAGGALSEADVRETAAWLRRWYPGTGYIVERVETRVSIDDLYRPCDEDWSPRRGAVVARPVQ
jgi:hypothetical protein